MKRVIIVYGLIGGAIVSGLMFATWPLWESGTLNFDNGQLAGYASMVIALSLIFFGIKSYRDNHSDGTITFGRAFQIGLMITLVASVMYALAWEVNYHTLATDFTERMTEYYFQEMQANGATEEELLAANEQWQSYADMYTNPVIRFGITLTEILPVGLLITLISSALLRKKEVLPS